MTSDLGFFKCEAAEARTLSVPSTNSILVPRNTTRLEALRFIKPELADLRGYNSLRMGEAVCWSPPPRAGEGGFHANS